MKSSGIEKICVCGAGTMGRGIAQLAAHQGFETILFDVNSSVLNDAKQFISQSIAMLVEKGRVSPTESSKIIERLTCTSDIYECSAPLVVEAILEVMDEKTRLFNALANINSSQTIFATNTSSLSVTKIAENVSNPERMVGMHFFNPAPIMKLVEIVRTAQSADSVVETVWKVATELNKTPVLSQDSPGFIVNRVARPYYIESLRLVEDGIANFEMIDSLLESTGFRMGPFKLMDLIGNDINFAVSTSLYEQLGRPPRLRPSYIQEEKVQLGHLGKKTHQGYFDYE